MNGRDGSRALLFLSLNGLCLDAWMVLPLPWSMTLNQGFATCNLELEGAISNSWRGDRICRMDGGVTLRTRGTTGCLLWQLDFNIHARYESVV